MVARSRARLRHPRDWKIDCGEHILHKDPVPRGGIVDQDVRHRAHDLPVLDNCGAAQVCGQERTTRFNEKFTKNAESKQTVALGGNVIQVDF